MGPQARQEYLAQLRDRYVRAGRKEKGRMLTEGGASERLCPRVSANAHNHSPFGNTCYGATKRRSVTLTDGSTRSARCYLRHISAIHSLACLSGTTYPFKSEWPGPLIAANCRLRPRLRSS